MTTIVRLDTPPPTTNNLFVNAGRRRVKSKAYKAWIASAGWQIKAQRPERVSGAVSLDIAVQRKRSNSDISNRVKAVEDLLVTMGVIDDDKNVTSVNARWADITGCEITIIQVGK